MTTTIGSVVLLVGLLLAVGAQVAIALHAFTGNPFKGLLCFVVPLYVFVYAKKHKVSNRYLWGWYLGIALLVTGGVMAS